MTSSKLSNHNYAAAKVNHYNDGSIVLQSYNMIVVEIDKDGWLQVNGLYSRTTIKHIGWFMREIGLTYQRAKELYNDNVKMNIHTGEIVGA